MSQTECNTDSEVWKSVDALLEEHSLRGIFSFERKSSVIIASERYDEMLMALIAKCEELQHQPGCQPYTRSAPHVGFQGREMSTVLQVKRDDGSGLVYHVTARVGRDARDEIRVSVRGPWLDNADWFWTEQAADRTGAVVIDHTHYRISPDLPASRSVNAGHAGRLFRIRKLASGEVIETRNLWYQGTVPPSWRDRLPDDAEFVKGETR